MAADIERTILRRVHESAKSCSQIRITFKPCECSFAVMRLSRSLLPMSLAFQNAERVFGKWPQRAQQCQKQPSTKIANFTSGKKKSGLPSINRSFTRQDLIPDLTINIRNTVSVVLFLLPLIRDMVLDRTGFTRRKPPPSLSLRSRSMVYVRYSQTGSGIAARALGSTLTGELLLNVHGRIQTYRG